MIALDVGGRYPPAAMAHYSIGIVYDLLGTHPLREGDPPDMDAEYEPRATVEALAGAIRKLGHEPRLLGKPHDLLRLAGEAMDGAGAPLPDAVLNISEGHGTRNREAWAPVLLEMLGIPALGSDALTLSLSLDKAWTKDVVAAAGVPTPRYCLMRSCQDAAGAPVPGAFPFFVKPRCEGTSKGIGPGSRVEGRGALSQEVERIVSQYKQPALVEAFLEGAEYTVTLVGNDPPRTLPVLQRAIETSTGIGLHALERHEAQAPGGAWEYTTPGDLSPELEAELNALGRRAFAALDCRDFARVDFRLDSTGAPQFLEINPLPTFAPDGSFAILAELAGRSYEDLLAEVLEAGLQRLGLA